MKVLITGSNGYLGSILKKQIKRHKIICNDINIYKGALNFKKNFKNIDKKLLSKLDAVVHLAGVSTNYDPPDKIYKKLARRVNTNDTYNLARKAKNCGVKKFIFASSASVYGNYHGKVASENSESKPTTSYAISKKKAENRILNLSDSNFKVIIFRMVTLYGYSPRMRFDVLINNLVANYLKNSEIILNSDGQLIRPQLHVLDVVQFYQQALDNNAIKSGIINIGRNDYNITILKIAKLISKKLNCILKIGKPDFDSRSYKVSFKKQNKIFKNIKFRYDFLYCFKEIFKYFNKNQNLENFKYYNLKTLENLKIKNKLTIFLK
jgi:nucleoside-diphosphate-sugar epimerase